MPLTPLAVAIGVALDLRARGVRPDPMDMGLGELWALRRVLVSHDAGAALRATSAAALGSRGSKADLDRHYAQLGGGNG